MFEQLNSQLKDSMKPLNEIAAMHMNTFQQLAQAQSSLLNSVINSNITFTQELLSQKDINGIVELHKNYASDMQETLATAIRDTYELLAADQEKTTELFKGAISTTVEPEKKTAAPKSTAK